MTIKTKWELSQRCYYLDSDGAIRTGTVSEIDLTIKACETHIVETIRVTAVADTLNTKTGNIRTEACKLFPDKESAGIAWLRLNGLDCGLGIL